MFCHKKLEVYNISIVFVGGVLRIIRLLPPGNADLANQLRRAAMSIPLNIAEGAGRIGKADKQKYYAIARGSALECASIFDIIVTWELCLPEELESERKQLESIVAMVSKLALR